MSKSDFAIASRQKLKDYKKITDFPFKNNWYELTLKRLIRYASDNGLMQLQFLKDLLLLKDMDKILTN